MGASTLGTYALSNRGSCYFFKKGNQPNLDIPFTNPEGRQTYRRVVGYATQADGSRRYWHFGIQARPLFAPSFAYVVSTHVIFTTDGATPWPSHRKMHSARRRQCKTWFNPEWRDRLLATLHWLSQGSAGLCLPAGANAFIQVSVTPEQFESDISYADPPTRKQRTLIPELEAETFTMEDEESEDTEQEDDELEERGENDNENEGYS
ncbi:MAG TPA: hypothetical protein VEU62_07075 [Bryobacterales bacterium]|nr:hypothetical protein [Bryobacterales bacterium]